MARKKGAGKGSLDLAVRLRAEVDQFRTDLADARQELAQLVKELKSVGTEGRQSARGLTVLNRNSVRAKSRVSALSDELARQAKESREAAKTMAFMGKNVAKMEATFAALVRELKGTAKAVAATARDVKKASAELERMRKSAERAEEHMGALRNHADRAAQAMRRFKQVIATVVLGRLVQALYQTAIQLDKFNTLMTLTAGNARLAADEMAFVKRTAYELGLSLEPSISGYAKLLSTIENTPLEGRGREMFIGISEAIRGFRLAGDDAEGVWRALIQVMSKGTVQADELRGQLGERIPGAFRIAAEAMGVTQRELSRMMDRGELISETFMPRFISRLREVASASAELSKESPDAKLARLANAFLDLKRAILDAGLQDIMEAIVDGLAAVTRAAATFIDRSRGLADMPKGLLGIDEQIAAKEQHAVDLMTQIIEKRNELAKARRGINLFGPDPDELRQQVDSLVMAQVILNRQINEMYKTKRKDERDREAKIAAKAEQEALEKEVESLRKYQAELESARLALGLTEEQQMLYQVSLKLATAQSQEQVEAVWRVAEALAGEMRALREAREERQLYKKAFPEDAAFDEYARQLNILERLRRKGKITDAEYQQGIDRLTESYLKLGDATEQVTKKTSYAAEAFKATAKGLQGLFASTFDALLKDGFKSFENFGQKLIDLFRGILARMAAMAIARPVIIPMVSSIGGMLGMSQEAIAGVTKELGGGAGASAFNPMLGLGLIAGGLAIGAIMSRRRRREEEARRAAEALQQVDRSLRILSGTSTETAEQIRDAIRELGKTSDPREQVRLIMERYQLEKQMLEKTRDLIESLAKRAESLSKAIASDKRRIQGQPDYRPIDQIRADVAGVSALTEFPDVERYNRALENYRKQIAGFQKEIERVENELKNIPRRGGTVDARTELTGQKYLYVEAIRKIRENRAAALGEITQAIEDWAKTAQEGIDRLSELRTETMRYYQAQQRLAEGMRRAVDTIDAALNRLNDMTRLPAERLRAGLEAWRAQLAEAKNLQGQDLADAIARLTSTGEGLVNQARDLYASGAQFSDVFGEVRAGLEEVRALAEQQGMDYQAAADDAQAILDDISAVMNDMKTGLDAMSADIVNAIEQQKNDLIEELQSLRESIQNQAITVDVTLDGESVTDGVVARMRERSAAGEPVLSPRGLE